MALEIHQGFKRTITNVYTAADGSPGVVEGVPVWSASVPEVVTLVPSQDGLSCDVIWNGVAAGLVVSSLADGDLGEGVFPISTSVDFDFVAPLGATSGVSSVSEEVPV